MNVVYRRISHELKLINMAGETYFRVYLDPNNMLNVHFTFLGPSDSPFAKGLYHGIIHLPQDYPHKPPEIVFLTNSGRFETNRYICTSFTSFHPESWNPTWGIRNIIIGLRSLFDEETPGSIGSVTTSPEVREKYALDSHTFVCRICGCSHAELAPLLRESSASKQGSTGDDTDQVILPPDTTSISAPAPESNDVTIEIHNDAQISMTEEKVQEDVLDVPAATGSRELYQEQVDEVQLHNVITTDPDNEQPNPDIDVEKSTSHQDTQSTGMELQIEPFSVEGSNNVSQISSEQGGFDFSNLALAAISRSLLHAAQNTDSEDLQTEEIRGLGLLAHLVAGASIPPPVLKLVSHLRDSAESIRAGIQPPNNQQRN